MSLRSFKGRFINPNDGSIHEGFLIAEAGRVQELTKKKAATGEVVQLEGFTIPGLIDAHVHICGDGGPDTLNNVARDPHTIMVARAIGVLQQHLKAGVTAIRDLGSPKGLAIHLRDAVNQGMVPGPRIWACGHNITITGGHGWQFGTEADGPDGVRKAARAELKAGANGLKFMATGGIITQGVIAGAEAFTVEEMRTGVEEAHKVGKRTAAHAQSLIGVKNALKAGIDTIEHGPFDRWDDEGLSLMLKQKAMMLPTLAPRELVLAKKAPARKILPKWLIDKAEAATKDQPGNVVQAYKAGVKIVASTDAGVPMMPHGLLHIELKVYNQLGFSKLNILRSATIYGAEALGWNDIGALEPGFWADMTVLKGNPLENVGAYAQVVKVVKGGEVVG